MLFQLLFGAGRMVAYTVHESPTPPADRMDRAEALRFVKDGFNGQAALLPPLWFAVHRLWLPLALYAAVAAALFAGYLWLGLPLVAAVAGGAALHLFSGFEADVFERGDLDRQGWTSLGSVTGASALECQRRFFEQWLPQQPILRGNGPSTAAPTAPQQSTRDAMISARGDQSAAGRLAALWQSKRP